jgi:hypothetical protein
MTVKYQAVNITMNYSISRAILLVLIFFSLSGCGMAVKTTNLNDVPTETEDSQIISSVGFVLHDEIDSNRYHRYIEGKYNYIAGERQSWIDALSSFTDRANIFVISNGKLTNIFTPLTPIANTQPVVRANSDDQVTDFVLPEKNSTSAIPNSSLADNIDKFPDFAKAHPMVHVYVTAVPEKQGLTKDDLIDGIPDIASFFTFGIIPAYYRVPYTATFTLEMPQETNAIQAHWDYNYDRKEYYWVPIFLPVSEYVDSFSGEGEEARPLSPEQKRRLNSLWKTEEKRRLVLMFLRDAKPLIPKH